MSKKVSRLFEQFQPENYQLELELDRDAMAFSGRVTVRGKKAGVPSQRLTFHQKELKITSAAITKHDKKGDRQLPVERINNHNSLDEVRLHSSEMVYPGNYTVTMEFKGKITDPMNGIYPCYFKHDGKDKQLIATQFESHHAREAFPCIDEPAAKATFDLTLDTPAGETTLGNTPIKTQKTTGGRKRTSFETTPKMSAYLLAFVTGDMDYKEAKTKNGVVVRSYATPDNTPLTAYSVEAAVRCLEFFEDYFGVSYPLAKLDMVALPDFSSGAMENWGLVTYRESIMLINDRSSSIESKQQAVLVIAHELSHQWFGNLVTMEWWDDLWLNESFANMMEYLAVDALYPEWHIWEMFVSRETAIAKRRDSLVDVQSIKCEVRHPDEISTLFDPAIVYAKGGSILRMLMSYIGESAFRRGLKIYFDKHAYSNTSANDLWEALGQASGQDITGFTDGWLKRPGFPLINANWPPDGKTLELSQQRFLSDPSATDVDSKPWQVPLAANRAVEPALLKAKKAQANVSGDTDKPLLLNHDGQSYFLPHYVNSEHMRQITAGIQDGQVNTIDRLLLLDNYNMLQRGGQASSVELLELLSGYQAETSESVWGVMAGAIGEIRKLVEGEETSEKLLDTLVQNLVIKLADKLGWDDSPKDNAQTLRLRGLAQSMAAGSKHKATLDEGLRRFRKFKKPADLPASTRSVVYYCSARYGSEDDFKKLLALHDSTQNADEKDEIAGALTTVKDPVRYKALLKLLKTNSVRRQDILHWFVWLLRNRYSRADTWQWLIDEWPWLEEKFASDKSYGYFARYPGSIFSRPDELKKFQAFFDDKRGVVAMSRDITLAEAEIKSRIAWRERNEAQVKAWLKKYRPKN